MADQESRSTIMPLSQDFVDRRLGENLRRPDETARTCRITGGLFELFVNLAEASQGRGPCRRRAWREGGPDRPAR
jgi:hypothetical protein